MSTVAFLGLGRMGAPMAANLVQAGVTLVVWNRTRERAESFAAVHNCEVAGTPRDTAAAADVVVSMLADDRALLDAYESAEGVLSGLRPGALAIDMGTVAPSTVAHLHAAVAERGGSLVDAPVSGSVAAAQAASLTIMAAGEEAAVDRARQVLDHLGDPVLYMGPSGAGAVVKLATNLVVHSLNGALSEALVLAERAGIERTNAYRVFASSAIAAPFVHYRRAAFERPDETPVAFRLQLAAKDLRLALDLAEQVGANLPQTQANVDLLDRAASEGYADRDESALAEFLRGNTRHPDTTAGERR